MDKVIAVVVTYRRKELLKKVIEGLLSQTYPLFKIIVVDNNSGDGTEQIITGLIKNNVITEGSEKLLYFNTGENLGGAGGFNKGFELASNYQYDYLWLMDDDVVASPDCLEQLVSEKIDGIIQPNRVDLHDRCVELSPVVYDLKKFFCLKPKRQTASELYDSGCINLTEINGTPFEGPLISANVVKEIGFPDPRFFIFYDDLEYSLRAREAGYKIYWLPKAKMTRLLDNNQSNDLKSWKGYFMLRNFFHIHYVYGETNLVKIKPFFIICGLLLRSVFKMDGDAIKVLICSFKDSFLLSNSHKHRP